MIVHVEAEVVEVAAARDVHVAEPPLLTVIATLPVGDPDPDVFVTVTVDVAVWP
jgi:hypothetical protein